jgi:hypothetical protein
MTASLKALDAQLRHLQGVAPELRAAELERIVHVALATVPKALALVRELEHVVYNDRDYCPWCFQVRGRPHFAGCEVAAVLGAKTLPPHDEAA